MSPQCRELDGLETAMSAYEFIQKTIQEKWEKSRKQTQWQYRGPGYGQRLLHVIGILEPYEVVTASMEHGWLGTCENFLKEFEVVA